MIEGFLSNDCSERSSHAFVYKSGSDGIPALPVFNGYTCGLLDLEGGEKCEYACKSDTTYMKHYIDHHKKKRSEKVKRKELLATVKCFVQRRFKCNQFYWIKLQSQASSGPRNTVSTGSSGSLSVSGEPENEDITVPIPTAVTDLIHSLQRNVFAPNDTIRADTRTRQDTMNCSAFYRLAGFGGIGEMSDEVLIPGCMSLSLVSPPSPQQARLQKIVHGFLHQSNDIIRSANWALLLTVQSPVASFSVNGHEHDNEETVGSEYRHDYKQRRVGKYLKPIQPGTITKYGNCIIRLFNFMFYLLTLDGSPYKAMSQFDLVKGDVLAFKGTLEALTGDVNAFEPPPLYIDRLRDILHKLLSAEMSISAHYTESLFHLFVFFTHCTVRENVVFFKDISKMTQPLAALLFTSKVIVLHRLSDSANSNHVSIFRLLSLTSMERLTNFAILVSLFKLADTWSLDDKVFRNQVRHGTNSSGADDARKMYVNDKLLHVDDFVKFTNLMVGTVKEELHNIFDDFFESNPLPLDLLEMVFDETDNSVRPK